MAFVAGCATAPTASRLEYPPAASFLHEARSAQVPLERRAADYLQAAAIASSQLGGDRGKGDSPNSTDGVVLYWSSHLDRAQSELIVPGPHSSFELPQTIADLERILLLHLKTGGKSTRQPRFASYSE